MSDEGKLFVGGLNYTTSEDTLAEAFGKYGNIETVNVIRDRETGRSRGFAFVKYDNPDDAKDAISGMNDKTIDGRTIRVDAAGKGGNARGSSGSRGRGGRGYARGGGYNGDRGYGERSYGDRSFGNSERSYGSGGGGGGYRSGGYSSGGGYRGNRGQGGYGERSGTYRDGYDGYE